MKEKIRDLEALISVVKDVTSDIDDKIRYHSMLRDEYNCSYEENESDYYKECAEIENAKVAALEDVAALVYSIIKKSL